VARASGATLADSRALFEAAADHGLPGYELFVDAHHPNLRGNLLLAESFARQVARVLNNPILRHGLSETDIRRELGFSDRDLRDVYANRFIWFCGESSDRADPAPTLRMAERYLGLAERGYGHRLPAYRFLLALLKHDPAAVKRCLSDKDALRRDREHLGSIACNREWASESVEKAGLPQPLASEAQDMMDFAGNLSHCGRGL
jgi:hypothetical protein